MSEDAIDRLLEARWQVRYPAAVLLLVMAAAILFYAQGSQWTLYSYLGAGFLALFAIGLARELMLAGLLLGLMAAAYFGLSFAVTASPEWIKTAAKFAMYAAAFWFVFDAYEKLRLAIIQAQSEIQEAHSQIADLRDELSSVRYELSELSNPHGDPPFRPFS